MISLKSILILQEFPSYMRHGNFLELYLFSFVMSYGLLHTIILFTSYYYPIYVNHIYVIYSIRSF